MFQRGADDAAGAAAGKVRGPFWPQPTAHVAASSSTALHSQADRRRGLAATLDEAIKTILATAVAQTTDLILSTQPTVPTVLTDAEYQANTQALLMHIEAQTDRWLQDDVIDIDTHRTGGLLELSFPDGSKIIINTQPPLHEVWLAARSGGFHYRWSANHWVDTRDGSEFIGVLSRLASQQAGCALSF